MTCQYKGCNQQATGEVVVQMDHVSALKSPDELRIRFCEKHKGLLRDWGNPPFERYEAA